MLNFNKQVIMDNKVCASAADFTLVKEEGTRVVIAYGLQEEEGKELATWYEVYCPKKQGKPTFDVAKAAIIVDINERITAQIVGGMTWEGKPVWLSIENQINFTTATAPCRLKIGEEADGTPVYHDFGTKAELKAFNDACLAWKNECLEDGRAEKESIDWTPYAEALQPVNE